MKEAKEAKGAQQFIQLLDRGRGGEGGERRDGEGRGAGQCAGGKYRSRFRKSEGGTRVEEERQIYEGRACGNESNLFFTHTHLW